MKDQFIPYNLALELKELGFDEPCFTTYDNEGRLRNLFDFPRSEYSNNLPYIEDTKEWIYNSDLNNSANFQAAHNPMLLKFFLDNPFTAAPLWQQAFKWFRKEHDLFAELYSINMGCIEYCFQIVDLYSEECLYDNFKGAANSYSGIFNSYEEARLACLVKLIEIVKSKK
jgi:hypothetical protein